MIDAGAAGHSVYRVARSLKFTVDREPIDLELGGEQYTAPALLAPATLADLLDKQAEMQGVFDAISKAGEGAAAEQGVMQKALGFVADIFDLILESESAARFRIRLLSKDNPFDLAREILPAITALIEEYTGRPTQPSPPSSTLSAGDGTTSTAGPLPQALTRSPLTPAGSAISSTTGSPP